MADEPAVYADRADLNLYAISEEALRNIDPEKVDGALAAASRLADSYLASQYTLPLTAYGIDLKMAVASLAAWILVSTAGVNPEGSDQVYAARNDQALRWLESVMRGGVRPAGMSGSGTNLLGGQSVGARPGVTSSSPRGFSSRGGWPGGGFVGD